ncbi:MAG: tail fiber domain-containing protein [Bacteroidia bacterium]|nr:tail fiber domain-containing protein [Bacteroidia bacterium]
MNLKHLILSSVALAFLQGKAQFLPGGNSSLTLNTTNNFLGSNASNNTFMRIGVNGSQDIFIDNDNSKLYPADASGRLHGGHWIGFGRVFTPTNGPGAWNFFTPKAHLHIDGGNNSSQFGSFGNGIRPWFNTGTLYTENSDGMYVGLRSLGVNTSYAVINWSDDAYGMGGSDFLSFNFTGGPTALQQSINGIELGRFNPTQGKGTLGVGNFQFIGSSTEPVRRLEILDADPANGINANEPQLRTTYTYNSNPNLGVFTEFQTTSIGNMYFNTRSGGARKNFGFHKNNPMNCVEINSHAGNEGFGTPNGSSGLRFTNLTSVSTPQANPGQGVLSVDADGDVIYVPGNGLATGNNGISITTGGVVQLGVACSFANIPAILANQFTTSRMVANRNYDFWFASLTTETGGVGVGGQPVLPFCGTGNTFEVSANMKNTKYGNTNASGMRFTKLLSTSPTIPNGTNGVNSSKVLTVDGDGDVVLIDNNNGTGLGNYCSDSIKKPLTDDYEIPMAGYNMNYTMPAKSISSFHLGNTTCVPTIARMNVYNDTLQVASAISSNVSLANNAIGLYSSTNNTGAGKALAIQGLANTSGSSATARGVRGEASATNGLLAEGVYGEASTSNGCQQNIAVGGLAANGTFVSIAGDFDVEYSNSGYNQGVNVEIINGSNANATNIGINTVVNSSATNNYGAYFVANGATNNYGVYASAPTNGDTIPGPNYAGYFNGDLVYTGSFGLASDVNLKTNIDTLPNALPIIKQLKPKQFKFNQANDPSMSLAVGLQYGLIAQDVETVLPNLVNNNVHPAKLDSVGNVVVPPVNFKSVEYEQLIPFLIKAMQEQQAKIDSLTTKLNSKDSIQDARLAALEAAIATCCSNNSAKTANNTGSSVLNQMDVELSDKDAIVLNQNVPNPFAEQTTITYNVPSSVGKAQLLFYNSAGQIIQTVDIKTRGKGKVNVFAADLSSGMYHYTLVADGQVVDSKKMVRE